MKLKTIFLGLTGSFLASCFSFGNTADTSSKNAASESVSVYNVANYSSRGTGSESTPAVQRQNEPVYAGNDGKGMKLGILVPHSKGLDKNQEYLPTMIQGVLVTNISKYSAISVVDRVALDRVIMETLDAAYEDNLDIVRVGNIAQVGYMMTGDIIRTSTGYSLQINVTDTTPDATTIASYSGTCTVDELDDYSAINRASLELLSQMNVQLTNEAKSELGRASSRQSIKAQTALAQGITVQRKGNDVEALDFFTKAIESDPRMKEAETRAQNLFTVSVGASIKERANYAQEQTDKWKKIFADLRNYLEENLFLAIYDFSTIEDTIDVKRGTVNLKVTPGLKVIPNGTALTVWKKIMDEWGRIKTLEENKAWANTVRPPIFGLNSNIIEAGDINYTYSGKIGLHDGYGDCISQSTIQWGRYVSYKPGTFRPLAQHKYFENISFQYVEFRNIPLKDITDTLTGKVDELLLGGTSSQRKIPIPVMSVAEWEQWLKENWGR